VRHFLRHYLRAKSVFSDIICGRTAQRVCGRQTVAENDRSAGLIGCGEIKRFVVIGCEAERFVVVVG
jgi:hypothetical protein